jgi:DNA-binding beta-propeller fold protein YncE
MIPLLCALAVFASLSPANASAQSLEFVGPLRMAESPLGLVVGDYVGRKVVILDPVSMQALGALPIYTDETQLTAGKPLSVAWLNNRLYVGEEYTGRIQVFGYGRAKKNGIKDSSSIDGKSQWVKTSPSLTMAPVVQPSAMVADEDQGLLFVASKGEKAVLVLDTDGNLVRTIGGPGSGAPLGKPQGIALDRVGQRVFVSDDGIENCTWMGCSFISAVNVYTYDGLWLGSIDGDTGNAGEKFSRAQDVAVDAAGRVYLADSFRHVVMVFEEVSANTFNALGVFGGKGSGPGQLLLPTGVLFENATDRIFVANTMLTRIEVFSMEDLVQ